MYLLLWWGMWQGCPEALLALLNTHLVPPSYLFSVLPLVGHPARLSHQLVSLIFPPCKIKAISSCAKAAL